MADPAQINVQAFQPFNGGDGKRFTVSDSSGASAYRITGLSGGTDGNAQKRVLITNGGLVPAYVRMGPSSVEASTDSIEILPGLAYLLTPPDVNPSGVWIAGITESGTTKISVVAGVGT